MARCRQCGGWLIQGWWGGSGIYLRDWGECGRTQFVCTSYSTIRLKSKRVYEYELWLNASEYCTVGRRSLDRCGDPASELVKYTVKYTTYC